MASRRISATEFSRNLSSFMAQVRYQNVSLEISKGNEIGARLLPPEPPAGFLIEQLDVFFTALPELGLDDADAFMSDLNEADGTVSAPRDPWES